MAETGWIKNWRSIREHWLWTTGKPFDQRSAWYDLIFRANHETKKIPFNGCIETVERGSFLTSTVKLADYWGWSRGKVTRFLDMLENDHMIVKKSDSKRTAITIVNYGKYQTSRSANDQETDSKSSIKRTSSGHKQELKEDKEEKNSARASTSDEWTPPPKGTPEYERWRNQ